MPVFAVRSAQRHLRLRPTVSALGLAAAYADEEYGGVAFDLCILTYGGMNTDLKLGIRPSVITGFHAVDLSNSATFSLVLAREGDDLKEELPFLFGRPIGAQAERYPACQP